MTPRGSCVLAVLKLLRRGIFGGTPPTDCLSKNNE
uniref:Uncharacterized protein n=1 Tax=Anguilla anguilla TaxID=7936 RepID=A0A0E9RGP7_ANGAN